MEIIVVTGQAKGVGKTTLVGEIIQNLKDKVGAIKCSIHDDHDSYQKTFSLADEPEIILQKGTDTEFFVRKGAEKVVLIQSNYQDLAANLNQVMVEFIAVNYLVIEGNSILDYLNPDLTIYVKRDGIVEKPSANRAKARAEMAINLTDGIDRFQITARKITCHQAHLISKALGIELKEIGRMLDDQGIKVAQCQLGLF